VETTAALPAFLDGQHLIETFGLAGMLFVIFAETGLLLGFFLPGDSLLFAAGYAATGNLTEKLHPNIVLVCALTSLVAIIGAQVGFTIGDKAGPALFDREDNRLFKKSHVTKAEEVLARYGTGRAIVLGRFIPIVRTFLNPIVGAGHLPAWEFFRWNVLGGVLWGTGVTLLGYFLGNISFIGKNLEYFAVLIVAISVLPIAVELLKQRRRSGA
jgi:membrane-associated protein